MKLQFSDSTAKYIQGLIDQLEKLIKSGDPISNENLIEVVNVATSRLNISSRELAGKFGVTPSTISRWKNGKNMPMGFARKAIIVEIIDIAKKEISNLKVEPMAVAVASD